jgi:hypothetical protein
VRGSGLVGLGQSPVSIAPAFDAAGDHFLTEPRGGPESVLNFASSFGAWRERWPYAGSAGCTIDTLEKCSREGVSLKDRFRLDPYGTDLPRCPPGSSRLASQFRIANFGTFFAQ